MLYCQYGSTLPPEWRIDFGTILGPGSKAALHRRIVAGDVDAKALRDLREWLDISQLDFARVFSTTERTLQRRESTRSPLSALEADLLHRIVRIADFATASLGDAERARRWLQRPLPVLGGATPLEMLRTEIGTSEVERALAAVAYGGVA